MNATDYLFEFAGGPQPVTAWLRRNGFEEIHVNRTMRETFEPSGTDTPVLIRGEDVRERATPSDMTRFLTALARGGLLSPTSSKMLLEIMSRAKAGVDWIPAMLPPGAEAAHKSGTLFGAGDRINMNSVGIITAPDGRRIALSIFAAGISDDVDPEKREASLAHISRSLYDYFLFSSCNDELRR